jgi:magnesium transporter
MASQVTFYLSRVIGRYCYSKDGKPIGKIKDLLIEFSDSTNPEFSNYRPRVTGILIKKQKKELFLDFNKFVVSKEDRHYKFTCSKQVELSENTVKNSLRLVDNVQDKQLVDLNGRKLVRVNDVKLVSLPDETFAIAVDVGLEGLLRRIGIAKPLSLLLKIFGLTIPSKFIIWEDISAVDFGHNGLTLSKSINKLSTLHPSDLADIIEDLGKTSGASVFATLDEEQAADVLEELEIKHQISIIRSMPVEKAADVLEKMPSDEVADILEELEDEQVEELLKEMDRESSEEVRELLEYSEKEVGSIMTKDFLSFNINDTVDETLNILRKEKPEADTIYSLFVVDNNNRFISVVSLRELVVSEPNTILAEIMQKHPITINDEDKIDSLAELVSKYNLLAIPVVNNDRILEGMVVIDDIVEDLLKKGKTK